MILWFLFTSYFFIVAQVMCRFVNILGAVSISHAFRITFFVSAAKDSHIKNLFSNFFLLHELQDIFLPNMKQN
jgi:hypothetical protein